MPIFMDRHDVRGVNAEDIAALHRKDVENSGQVQRQIHGLLVRRRARHRLLRRSCARCRRRRAVHRDAHGEIAGEIIPVDL